MRRFDGCEKHEAPTAACNPALSRHWRQRYAKEFAALLEDIKPGSRALIDVLKGALVMQFRFYGMVPIIGALIGAAAGGVIAFRMPVTYSSSALMIVHGPDVNVPEFFQTFNSGLSRVLGTSAAERAATVITIHNRKSKSLEPITYLSLTYNNSDAIQAQRVASTLTALAADNLFPSVLTVVDPPVVPQIPKNPKYLLRVVSGFFVGLTLGGLSLLLLRSRHGSGQPADVN